MNQKPRRVRETTRAKEQSYLKGVFAEATISGRNNEDSDSAAESDNDENADDRWFSGFNSRIADIYSYLFYPFHTYAVWVRLHAVLEYTSRSLYAGTRTEVVLWRHPMTSYEKLTYTRN